MMPNRLHFISLKKESKEFKYLQNQRELLGGDVPFRSTKANKLSVPDITIFDELLKGTGSERCLPPWHTLDCLLC